MCFYKLKICKSLKIPGNIETGINMSGAAARTGKVRKKKKG